MSEENNDTASAAAAPTASLTERILNMTQKWAVNAEKTARSFTEKSGLPIGVTDLQIHNRYANKSITLKFNALLHLHLGTKVLEYLVKKNYINYGPKIFRIEECNTIIRKNRRFIDALTLAHEKGAHIDGELFAKKIHSLTQPTLNKLVAILLTGKSKLGSQECELAQQLPYPLKVIVALAIDNLCKIYYVDNEVESKCNEYITSDKKLDDTEIYNDFLEFMKSGIWWGNGTKAYRAIRISVASYVSLSRNNAGVDKILERVQTSIDDSNPLLTDALEFEDLPEFEEQFDNMHALFNDEEIDINNRGACFAVIACVGLMYHRRHLEMFASERADILYLLGKENEAKSGGEAAIQALDAQFNRLKFEFITIIKGYVDGSDNRTGLERTRDLKSALKKTAEIFTIFAMAKKIRNRGRIVEHMGQVTNDLTASINDDVANKYLTMSDDDIAEHEEEMDKFFSTYDPKVSLLNEFHQSLIRQFYIRIVTIFTDLNETGHVIISDKKLMPSQTRLPYFQDAVKSLVEIKKEVFDNLLVKKDFRTENIDKTKVLTDTLELSKNLLLYLNFHAVSSSTEEMKLLRKEELRKAKDEQKAAMHAERMKRLSS